MRILRIDIKISFHKFFGQGISVLLSSKHSFPSFSVFMEFRKPRGRTRRKNKHNNILFNNLTLSIHPCSLRNILRSENLRFREIPLETLSSDQERRDFSIHRFSIDPQKGNIHFFYFGHPYRNMKRQPEQCHRIPIQNIRPWHGNFRFRKTFSPARRF